MVTRYARRTIGLSRSTVVMLASVAAAGLAVSACSSSGSGSGGSGGSVTFGVLHPFTGSYASVGEASLQGASVAEAEINANGGIMGGKQLKLVHADTLGDPVDAVPAANSMIARSSPTAVVGPGGLEIGAIQPILDKDQIPFEFEGGDTAFDNTKDPMLWRDSPSDAQEGVAMAAYAISKGWKKAAFMMSSITTAQDFIPFIKDAYTKLGGTVVSNQTMTPGQTSYRSEALNVVQAHPQVIFSQVEPPTAAVMTQNLKEINNLAIPIVASDTSAAAEWIKAVTPAVAHKDIYSCEGATATTPATPVFNKFLKQAFPGKPALASANYSYDATIALALAIDMAGSTDGPTFAPDIPKVTSPPGKVVYDYASAVKAIKAGQDINYEGASGSMDYNQFHNVYGPYELVQVDTSGNEHVVKTISASTLEKDTP